MATTPAETSGQAKDSRGTRRRFLAGGVGAGAAVMVGKVATSVPADAATGDNLTLGQSNSASSETSIDATTAPVGHAAFQVNVTGGGSLAVLGATAGGIGVQGSDYGGPENLVGTGVYGTSDLGSGVLGQGGTYGVWGIGGSSGAGVMAQNAGSGPALQVDGSAIFSRSGLASIAAGDTSATVAGVSLTASSLVLANLQNSLPGVFVEAVIPTVPRSEFKIKLSKAVPAGDTAEVGWFVVN